MKLLIVLFALLFCLSAFADNKKNDPYKLTKAELKELAKSADWREKGNYLSKDGKIRYSAHWRVGADGRPELVAKKSYLPAVTDGITKTHKTSYFGITPKTLRYIGKFGKATNAVGISMLMIDVLGDGVDWMLDPENNSVVFDKKTTGAGLDAVCYDFFSERYKAEKIQYIKYSRHIKSGHIYCRVKLERFDEWELDMFFDEGKQVMSEQELDNIIRDLAKAGNINAKQVILDAGKDEIENGEHDEAIERLADDLSSDDIQDDTSSDTDTSTDDITTNDNNSSTSSKDKTDTQQQPETATEQETSTKSDELPPFCDWATIVCDFIGTTPDMPDEQLLIKDVPLKTPADFDKDYVSFGGQCPADINVEIDLVFAKHTISYSFTPICDFVENYLSIVIIFGAYLFATLHISSAFKI